MWRSAASAGELYGAEGLLVAALPAGGRCFHLLHRSSYDTRVGMGSGPLPLLLDMYLLDLEVVNIGLQSS